MKILTKFLMLDKYQLFKVLGEISSSWRSPPGENLFQESCLGRKTKLLFSPGGKKKRKT